MAGLDLCGISVMVAEDNAFSRQIMRTTLRALALTDVREARDGVEALEITHQRPPDLVFIDWDLPHLDGVEFTRMVRTAADSPNPYLPVIMISAHATPFHVRAARDAGVNEYLVKPYSAAGLFSRVRAVIERPRLYVRTKTYFGPDRRRKEDPAYRAPNRRGNGLDPRAPTESLETERVPPDLIDRALIAADIGGGGDDVRAALPGLK